jgi:hypothetical protein
MDNNTTTELHKAEDKVKGISKFKDFFETIGKIALGVLGMFYVTGLIVVSTHLNQYGVFSLNLLRVNYIMAGIWALLPIFVSLTILIIGWSLLQRLYASQLFQHFFAKSKNGRDDLNILEVGFSLLSFVGFIIDLMCDSFLIEQISPLFLMTVFFMCD